MNGRAWVVEVQIMSKNPRWIMEAWREHRYEARDVARQLRASKWNVRVRQYVRTEGK